MKRLIFLLTLSTVLMALVWVAGCSDSDDTVGSNLPEGDTNDLGYQFVEDEIFDDQLLGGVDMTLMMSVMLVDSIPGAIAPRALSPSNSLAEDFDVTLTSYAYNYNSGWHVFTLAGYAVVYDWDGNDTIDFDGVDSLQILANGVVQQTPGLTTDELRYRAHLDMTARDGEFTREAFHNVTMEQLTVGTQLVELNGTMAETVEAEVSDTTGSCTLNYVSAMTADGIQMDLDSDACPQAGTMNASVTVSLTCVGTGGAQMSVDGTWTATATFDGLTETTVVSDGTNQWTEVDTCGVS